MSRGGQFCCRSTPYKRLPEGTRLHGQVWTAGEKAIVRYSKLQVPGGQWVPFCSEVQESFGGQMKDPASPKGVAIIQDSGVFVKAISRYGEKDAVDEDDSAKVYIFR